MAGNGDRSTAQAGSGGAVEYMQLFGLHGQLNGLVQSGVCIAWQGGNQPCIVCACEAANDLAFGAQVFDPVDLSRHTAGRRDAGAQPHGCL